MQHRKRSMHTKGALERPQNFRVAPKPRFDFATQDLKCNSSANATVVGHYKEVAVLNNVM
jgi:hypothetical protein